MKMTMKAVVTSVVAVALLLTAVISVTYSWFSDSEDSEINVTAGKVEVGIEASDLKLYSNDVEMEGKFSNGGTASIDTSGDKLAINIGGFTPGDSIRFNIKFLNDSTINILWRSTVTFSGDSNLIDKIVISKIDDSGKHVLETSDWSASVGPETKTLDVMVVEVAFPKDANVTGECKISLGVEAVQSNADVFSSDNLVIYSKNDLYRFAEMVNEGVTFEGKTITLANDIDLEGSEWTPIAKGTTMHPDVAFKGVFDGNNKTISNFVATDVTENDAAAGLFGTANNEIKNLTVDGATIISSHYAGAICGFSTSNSLKITDCKVLNCTIVSNPEEINGVWDNGDKVGGVIGYTGEGGIVSNCTVEKTTIQGYRNVAGIAGFVNDGGTVSGCNVTDITIIQDYMHDYKGGIFDGVPYGPIYTTNSSSTVTNENNNYSNVDVKFSNLNIDTDVDNYTMLSKVPLSYRGIDYVFCDGSITTSKVGGNINRQIDGVSGQCATIVSFNALSAKSTLSFERFTFTGTFSIDSVTTYDGCKFFGIFVKHYANCDVLFNGCLFEHDSFGIEGANDYPVWIQFQSDAGTCKATFTDCTIDSKKPLKFKSDSNTVSVSINGCNFDVSGPSSSNKYCVGVVFEGKYNKLTVSDNTMSDSMVRLIAIYGGTLEIENSADAFVCENNKQGTTKITGDKLIGPETWHDANYSTQFDAWKSNHNNFEFLS